MDGILIIDKPYGMTSHDVVNWLRKKYKQKKFGHTGTLDPNATGVLVVLCGKSCKLLQFLSDTDKEYIGQIEFGKSTSTDDIWGEVEAEKEVNLDFSFSEELQKFVGKNHQLVPKTSNKKVNGKKLMDYQREGLEVPKVYSDIYVLDHLDKINYQPIEDVYQGKRIRLDNSNNEVCILDAGKPIAIYEQEREGLFKSKRGLW